MNEERTPRAAQVSRKTGETDVSVRLDLDGSGQVQVETGIPFFDHMLTLMGRHGGLDLAVRAVGDIQVDFHHTVEDVGLTFGQALARALGEKRGIARFGQRLLPMDEALAEVALDLSGRPFLVMNLPPAAERTGTFDRELARQFFQAVATAAGVTLHLTVRSGDDLHHILESVFKGFGVALREAVSLRPGSREIPSTKGIL
jgi:imidazoleglycerol-phosphate dehydratase